MKEDYLWNKTGNDPEIRELEATLAVFKHEPGSAPVLPIRFAENTAGRSSWALWLRFAFAASAAAVVVALAVWIWAVQEREVLETRAVQIETTLTQAVPETMPSAENRNIDKPYIAETDPPPHSIKTSAKSRPASVRRTPHVKDHKTVARASSPALTSEEKYAYERLMLALSITGSKLKIVRDTIDGNTSEDGANRSDKR